MADIEKTSDREQAPARRSVWDSFGDMEPLFRRMGLANMPWGDLWGAVDGIDFTPLADIEETDDAWSIDAELPGVSKKDIEVETSGRSIIIRGERKEKEREGVLRQKRRVTGTFRYEVTLPGEFDPAAIDATLDQGVLVVTVPKAMAEKPHRVKIG